jgi:glutamine synthetase
MASQTPKDVLKFAKDNKSEAVDLKFLDLLGHLAALHDSTMTELSEELFDEGSGFDGSSIAAGSRSTLGHARHPGPDHGRDGSLHGLPTLSLICNIVDPDHQGGLLARPAQHRAQGRSVSQVDGHR